MTLVTKLSPKSIKKMAQLLKKIHKIKIRQKKSSFKKINPFSTIYNELWRVWFKKLARGEF